MKLALQKKTKNSPVQLSITGNPSTPPIKHEFSSADFDKLLQFFELVRQSNGIEIELELNR